MLETTTTLDKPQIPHRARAQVERGTLADRLLIGKSDLAKALSTSERTIDRWVATGMMPRPLKNLQQNGQGRALWRVNEIDQWVRDGCPPLSQKEQP